MTKYVMVPVEPTDTMAEQANERAAPYMVDARNLWAVMLSAAPSPWRPISECPKDDTLVMAYSPSPTHGAVIVEVVAWSVGAEGGYTHFMLASDFPLPVPVEGE